MIDDDERLADEGESQDEEIVEVTRKKDNLDSSSIDKEIDTAMIKEH